VAGVLTECPNADVLVTSRERLRVQGEHVYSVPVLGREEARRLFVTRARAVRPDFEPDELLDDLCARLDDLPLALELAAARTSLLSTAQLLERLGTRLDLLRGGRDAEARQQTLRATIEWSFELLDSEERTLLAALSLFRGGWTVEAAERVCEADVELLQSLADKSLIRRWESGRFGMLETIREFAAEQLSTADEDELLRRLLDYLLELFEDANLGPHLRGEPRMGLAQEERPNVDVALACATDAEELVLGFRLMELLEMYWSTNDPMGARTRVDSLLALAGEDLDSATHSKALRLRGGTFDMTGRSDLAEPEYERALELLLPFGHTADTTHLILRIANAASQQGDHVRAKRLATEALESGAVHWRDEAIGLTVLSKSAFAKGDAEEGARLAHLAADAAERLGFMWWRGITLLGAAEQELVLGELEGAKSDFASGLETLATVRDLVNLPIALAAGSALAARLGDAARAGTLWGALEAEAEREPKQTTIANMKEYEPYLEPVRGDAFEEGREQGRTLSLEEAVAYALERDSLDA